MRSGRSWVRQFSTSRESSASGAEHGAKVLYLPVLRPTHCLSFLLVAKAHPRSFPKCTLRIFLRLTILLVPIFEVVSDHRKRFVTLRALAHMRRPTTI